MPRSWSNVKLPPPPSPAERAKTKRPSSVTLFVVLLTLCVLFFAGLTFYSAYYAETHQPASTYQAPGDRPKDG